MNFKQPNEWQDMIKGDVVFSCMGTTLKAAGSKERQYEIDYTYQLEFAKAAHSNGVAAYILVSSAMANSKSRLFYTRMKGELEDAIHQLHFQQEVIMRPPSLIRKNTTKTDEKIAAFKSGAHTREYDISFYHILPFFWLFKVHNVSR